MDIFILYLIIIDSYGAHPLKLEWIFLFYT